MKLSALHFSKASLNATDSLRLWSTIGQEKGWIAFQGTYDELESVAETYINNHAYVDTPLGHEYTRNPLAIFRCFDGDEENAMWEGLVYSNGGVGVRYSDNESPQILLYIDKRTAEVFGYSKLGE